MRIKIYQIDSNKDTKREKFRPLSNQKINPSIYKKVFYGDVVAGTLEDIFIMFNDNRPPTHQGHSLSVSDIIEIIDGEGKVNNKIYYCDRIGFKEIKFDTSKCAEMVGMDVVYVTPGNPAIHIRIGRELSDLQNAVGGLIEPIYNGNQIVIANEESKLIQEPPNRTLENGIVVHGPFFVCGDDGENFTSLNENEINKYIELFSKPEIFPEDYKPDLGFTIYGF